MLHRFLLSRAQSWVDVKCIIKPSNYKIYKGKQLFAAFIDLSAASDIVNRNIMEEIDCPENGAHSF